MTVWANGGNGVLGGATAAFFATGLNGEVAGGDTACTFTAMNAGASKIPQQGALLFGRATARDADKIRGYVPGVFNCWQSDYRAMTNRGDTVRAALDGKEHTFLLKFKGHGAGANGNFPDIITGLFALDITGPWR